MMIPASVKLPNLQPRFNKNFPRLHDEKLIQRRSAFINAIIYKRDIYASLSPGKKKKLAARNNAHRDARKLNGPAKLLHSGNECQSEEEGDDGIVMLKEKNNEPKKIAYSGSWLCRKTEDVFMGKIEVERDFRGQLFDPETGEGTVTCEHCFAAKFPGESETKCCGKGSIILESIENDSRLFKELFRGDSERSDVFRKYSTEINSAFSMANMTCQRVKPPGGGWSPTVVIQGRVSIMVGAIKATEGKPPAFAQLYVMDPEFEDHEDEIRFEGIITRCSKLLRKEKPVLKVTICIALHCILCFLSMAPCFFIDARGGTGKTFLLNTILDYARSLNGEKRIAIAVASSGIAATLLSLGKTFHSCFKVPIQHGRVDPFITFNIAKDSVHAKIIREATLIVWDEAPMSHRYLLEGLDRTLRDVMNSKEPFGGKIVLLAGDFRQVLPVIRRGSRAQTTRAAINRSPLWQFFDMNTLVENVRIGKDPARSEFRELLQRVGEGKVPNEVDPDYIRIPEEFLFEIDDRCESTINDSLDKFIDLVFPNLKDRLSGDPEEFSAWIAERAILTPRNDAADCINDRFLRRYPGSEVECCSADSTMMEDDAVGFSVEFLNEQNPSGMPPHCLNLKAGFVLILLRNLNPKKGLCNGTRLIVVHASNVLLECIIAGGDFAGEMVLIPRLNLIANEGELPMRWRRRQFPVKVAFAMTINKAQGQTLRTVGIWLRDPVFSHGQFYVGISRVGDPKELHVAICRSDGGLTRNVVYAEALSSCDDTNGSKVYISRTEQRNPVKRRLDMNPPDDDVPALKSSFIQDEDVMSVEPFEDESDQIMSTVLHSRNLFRDSNKAQEPQNRFFSCGPDAFLDLLFFGVLPHLTEDVIPSKCTTAIDSEIESCDCAFCSTLSNFTKKIIRYYDARKCIVDRNQLLSLNSGMWDEMVNLQPASFQPKGTVNAAIQTLPSLLQNEEILATSQISPTFGVTRVARCPQCSTRSPRQYLPSLELYVQNRASLKTLILEAMIETPYRCEACDSGLEICEITFGDFLIINLAHSTDENFRTDPNFLVGFFKIDDISYRLRGMIKNTGGHYIAIVEHLNRCFLLDDLRDWPVCGTSFDYCLTALDDRKRVYLNDTCLIVYQKC